MNQPRPVGYFKSFAQMDGNLYRGVAIQGAGVM
jgi:hypothetical protein